MMATIGYAQGGKVEKFCKIFPKLLTFWIPISSFRKKIRSKISSFCHVINKSFFDELILKYNELQSKKDAVNTIVLGSSHGAAGFISKQFSQQSFNLASASQDLYYSYSLFKYCTRELKNLKNVYLFYSVFLPDFELQMTNEKERCAYFKFLYNIPYKNKACVELDLCYMQAKAYYKAFQDKIDTNGYIEQKVFFDETFTVEKRVEGHLRENKRENNQMLFLQKIIDECKLRNINLKIVIPPARKDYRNLLPNFDVLFQKLLNITPTPEILNFYDSPFFTDADFGDFDHLNSFGAVKLTNFIKEKVQNL